MNTKNNNLLLIISIAVLYTTWSSTYLAIRVAVQDIPPIAMVSARFTAAGLLMYILAVIKGEKQPGKKQWLGGSIVGVILFTCSNTMLCFAEKAISSSVSAVAVSSGALWMCIFSGFFGKWPTKTEWIGVLIGFLGIAVLSLGTEMRTNIFSSAILVLSSVIWALGSVLSKKLAVPAGFMGNAVEMTAGGIGSFIISLFMGVNYNIRPSSGSIIAVIYLIIIGAMVGFSAFMYVFQNARPALASSYAYVNPIGAVWLGAVMLKEKIGMKEIIALVIVVIGVIIVATAQAKQRTTMPEN